MDLRTRYTVKVSLDDLTNGKMGDSFKCMFSRGLAKTIPDASSINVDTQSVVFSVPHEGELVRLTYLTPPVLQAYVIAFDAGEELWPFRVTLKDPHLTRRPKRAKAAGKAAVAGTKTRQKAIRAGASSEEASALATANYQQVRNAAFQHAHKVYADLIAHGDAEGPVDHEEAVRQAAESAGLFPIAPDEQHHAHSDPLFALYGTRTKTDERNPTPRVFKTRRRRYGMRALRINWPIDPVTGNRIRPDVTRLV